MDLQKLQQQALELRQTIHSLKGQCPRELTHGMATLEQTVDLMNRVVIDLEERLFQMVRGAGA
jgi:hypothetical protein